MRSNNAFILLPYNLFEFSLLSEVIATEVGLQLGSMSYYALSMHVYENDYATAQEVAQQTIPAGHLQIPDMPRDPAPMQQVQELVKLEAEARQAASGFAVANFAEWITHGEERLNPYWLQYYYFLLTHMAKRQGFEHGLKVLQELITEPWSSYLDDTTFQLDASKAKAAGTPERDLFGDSLRLSEVNVTMGDSLQAARLKSLEKLIGIRDSELSKRGKNTIAFSEFQMLRNTLVGNPNEPVALAARNLSSDITLDEFDRAFSEVRENKP